jgi:hypothetical protein
MVLIEIMRGGRSVRRCDARCHRARPGGKSRCCCKGLLRGIERRGIDPESLDPGFLNWVRAQVELRADEYVQLRIGA